MPEPSSWTTEILRDPVALTRALVDVESVSGQEKAITDLVENALREAPYLQVDRVGNVVRAQARSGAGSAATPERIAAVAGTGGHVILAGHLDTVPVHDNLPARLVGDLLYGCGTSDMKSGAALALHLAVTVPEPVFDVTYLFYDCEEIEAARNGLRQVSVSHPQWLAADFAVLLEPTYGLVEAGCQGTLRAAVAIPGVRAHSARSWQGVNAIHGAAPVLARLAGYSARRVTIDGCDYHEGLNAVHIRGGVAGNVIPDECVVEVNFRFAPDRTVEQAEAHVREVFAGHDVRLLDSAPGALPALDAAPARAFLTAVGHPPVGKLGWTDVARFAALGVPALNYGPGDPNVAHASDERVELAKIRAGAEVLRRWLTGT
jgi:succinyl-diaminopimelate desuccinylase